MNDQLTRRNRRKILTRDSYRCFYCGLEVDESVPKQFSFDTATIDHLTPQHRGGSHDSDNLVTACMRCNLKKRRMTLEEYRLYIAREDSNRGAAIEALTKALELATTPYDGSLVLAIKWLESKIPEIMFPGEMRRG